MLPTRSIPPLTAPLTDGELLLRPEIAHDIPEILVAHDDDADLFRRRGLPRPPSGAELGRRIEEAPARRRAGLDETLSILDGGAFAGQLVIHSIEWEDRRAELGLWLRTGARGRGLGRRALVLAAGWSFAAWPLARLTLLTAPDNAAMLACARAAGFREEGVLRGHTAAPGGPREDAVVLSLLPIDLEGSGPAAGLGDPPAA